jgi:transposase
MTAEGMGPCVTVSGSITSEVFEAYVEQILAPTLKESQIIVMDNLRVHKTDRV